MTSTSSPPEWGRVLIAGGTDWAKNGKPGRNEESDAVLVSPHIIRSISHLKITKVLSGCAANYAMAIDINGVAHMFGKLPALAPVGSKGIVPLDKPIHVSPRAVGLPAGSKWVGGAVGRYHFFLLDDKGTVWGAGQNILGQLGLPSLQEVPMLTKIDVAKGDKVVQITAGNTFSLFLTNKGKVYACGSAEHGQLGNGTTGERIVKGNKTSYDVQTPPQLVKGELEGKNIVEIASGNQHSVALDDEGYIYAWGYAGYGRLGLGDQKDKMVPTIVPQFCDSNPLRRVKSILCGPTSSVVVDGLNMYQIAGKWKLTGDGSNGAPYTSFKVIQDVANCSVEKAALGGVTHFMTTYLDKEKTEVQTIGWGQGAIYGELGLGPDRGKSSTKAVEIPPLRNTHVIDIAAAQFFTLFLAHPNEALSELDRIPYEVSADPTCLVCHEDKPDVPALECERCDAPYHPGCLSPPLSEVPEGEWFCPKCVEDSERTFDDEPLNGSVETGTPSRPSTPLKRPADSQDGNGSKKARQ